MKKNISLYGLPEKVEFCSKCVMSNQRPRSVVEFKNISNKKNGLDILMKQKFKFSEALKTALGMSFISMISMEIAMNLVDYLLVGEARLTWWVIPFMLTAGFLTPWPYNYWRLKKFNEACH